MDFTGGSGNDTLNGTGTTTDVAETFVAGAGNDTLIGGGGADVMFGGAGHDVFVLTTTNTGALAAGLTGGQIARVLGGSGIDTLRRAGGAGLNLTTIANVGGGGPGSLSRVESIEKIDLSTDTAANALTLATRDIVDMSGMNVFNNGTVTLTAGSLGAAVARHQVWVDGNTQKKDSGGSIACAVGPTGGGCVGFGWWEKESDYQATVWDLQNRKSTGSVSANVNGTSAMIGVVVPIPLIARVQTAACDRLATQLRGFLQGDGTPAPAGGAP